MDAHGLTQMPNIGRTLAQKLVQAEIHTAEQLISSGSRNAFLRIRAVDPEACIDMLYALEGAVQNIRWHQLDSGTKEDLLRFFHLIETSGNNG